MKRILTLLMLFASLLSANVKYAKTYDAALKQAEAEKKIVLVMLSREGCDACWYMENVVFKDKAVAELINKEFVALYLDIHHDNLQGLDFIGTPTFHFLSPTGVAFFRYDGGANVKDFTAVLQEALSQ